MLEICPSSLCAYESRVACRGHSTGAPNSRRFCVNWGGSTGARNSRRFCVDWGGRHSRPFPGQAAAVRDRVTPPGPASLRTAGSRNSRRLLITILESYSCRMRRNKQIKIILLRKNRGATPPRAIMLLTFSFSIKACGMSRYAKFARNSSRICTYGFIELKRAVESTLTPENRCVRSLGIASPKALPEDRCSEQTR
jgi:hypothetical protein